MPECRQSQICSWTRQFSLQQNSRSELIVPRSLGRSGARVQNGHSMLSEISSGPGHCRRERVLKKKALSLSLTCPPGERSRGGNMESDKLDLLTAELHAIELWDQLSGGVDAQSAGRLDTVGLQSRKKRRQEIIDQIDALLTSNSNSATTQFEVPPKPLG